MKFICPEFNQNVNELYHQSTLNQSVISYNNNLYYKSRKIDDSQNGVLFYYLTDTMREVLLTSWYYDGTAYTPADYLAHIAIGGTDHTSFSGTFDWNCKSAMQIHSGYFYTIIAEDGIHFAKPERITTSKQIGIEENNIISKIEPYETEFSYSGESNEKFYIGDDKQTVTPITIDDTFKTARINKYKSLQDVIMFQSGADANPLDYVFRNGYYYIIVSRSIIKTDLYIYTAVLECKDSYTFSGDDITPAIPLFTNSALPWLIDIDVFQTPGGHTNFFSIVVNASDLHNGELQSSGAQNAEIYWPVVLSAGTWTFSLMHCKGGNIGIYTVYFDSTSVGTIDGYNGLATKNNISTITSISVTSSGKAVLKLKMATKNASSSGYYGDIQHVRLIRTA